MMAVALCSSRLRSETSAGMIQITTDALKLKVFKSCVDIHAQKDNF